MKKCASCTKDLPDAALHCVFCGAKQPPAPATAGGMAKTVMGAYSASDMMDHLKQQGHAQQPPPAAPYRPSPSPSQPPPAYQPPPAAAPSYQQPTAYQKPAPQMPPTQPAPMAPPAGLAPASNAQAKTMFAGPPAGAMNAPGPAPAGAFGGGPAPAGAFGAGGGAAPAFGGHGPMSHPVGNSPSHASSVPLAAPPPPQPVMPVPSAAPPYLASQTAARAGRPIEPWKDSLRTMMFIWGGLLLLAFATPISIDPLKFQWDLIANAEGVGKLPPLIMAAVGVLSLAIAGIPMSPAPRGILAALLGLTGALLPMFLAGMPPWQALLPLGGMILLIPSLLVRDEYRDASLPRILITVGVIATLVPFLIPQNGSLPLVELFKAAIEAPGAAKVLILLILAQIVIVVLALLAWMPAPASGGAKIFAWLLILSPVAIYFMFLVLTGMIENIPDSPALADIWVAGSASSLAAMGGKEAMAIPLGFGFGVAYAILIGYGLATVVGKKLE